MTRTNRDAGKNISEPIDSVLLRAAKEAYLLHGELAQLEQEISQTVITTDAASLAGLQRVDAARQSAEGLSRFLSRLAVTIDPSGNCDPAEAAYTLTLRDQACRLAAAPANAPPTPESEPEVW